MKIIVDGKEAVLKPEASFEYVSENPLFTEAEDYSFDIEFPMKDCPQNVLIFGALHVKAVDINRISFPCEIVTESFEKTGILAITEVNDSMVKGQFLEGMSQQNFQSDPDLLTYITDLDFSDYDGQESGFNGFPQWYYIYSWDSEWGYGTWSKDPTKSGPAVGWDQAIIYDTKTEQPYDHIGGAVAYNSYIQRHIYLAHLIDLVGQVLGWSVDQSILRALPFYQYILVANRRKFLNSFPYNWSVRPLCDSLPRWTVREFFQNIADYFGCVVEFDSVGKNIKFSSYRQVLSTSGSLTKIPLQVRNDFEVNLSDEDSKYKGSQSFVLPDECNPDNINSCPWIINDNRVPVNRITKTQLLQYINKGATESWNDNPDLQNMGIDDRFLFYLTDIQRYAVVTQTKKYWIGGEPDPDEFGNKPEADYVFQCVEIINQYGGQPDGTELKVCNCPFKPVKYLERDDPTNIGGTVTTKYGYLPAIEIPEDFLDVIDINELDESCPKAIETLSGGERKTEDCYFDKLWIFLMMGDNAFTREYEPRDVEGTMLEPVAGYDYKRTILDENGDPVMYPYTSNLNHNSFTLSPNIAEINAYRNIPKVDESKLYRYKFLSDTLPDPKAIYVIRGKEYACLRLTAHFSVKGMSQLIEGEFYEIVG